MAETQNVEIEELLSFFNMEKFKLQTLQTMHNEHFNSEKRELDKKEEVLKSKITDATQVLRSKLTASHDKTRIEIEGEISRMDNQIDHLNKCLQRTNGNAKTDIKKVDTKHAVVPMESVKITYNETFQRIVNMPIGECAELSFKEDIGIELAQSYDTGLFAVDCVSVHKSKKVCLNSKRNNIVRVVELKEDSQIIYIRDISSITVRQTTGDILLEDSQINIIKDIPSISVRHAAFMPSGEILMAIRSEPVIKIQTTTGEIKDFFHHSTSSWIEAPATVCNARCQ